MWSVRKVSSHFEYLENQTRGLDVIGSQSEVTLPRMREQLPSYATNQTPLSEVVCGVIVSFTMTQRIDL